MSKVLVLAYESEQDLPKTGTPTQLFGPDTTDGFLSHRDQLTVSFESVFIRHPDPVGSPRSWYRAIEAVAMCITVPTTVMVELWYDWETQPWLDLLVAAGSFTDYTGMKYRVPKSMLMGCMFSAKIFPGKWERDDHDAVNYWLRSLQD